MRELPMLTVIIIALSATCALLQLKSGELYKQDSAEYAESIFRLGDRLSSFLS